MKCVIVLAVFTIITFFESSPSARVEATPGTEKPKEGEVAQPGVQTPDAKQAQQTIDLSVIMQSLKQPHIVEAFKRIPDKRRKNMVRSQLRLFRLLQNTPAAAVVDGIGQLLDATAPHRDEENDEHVADGVPRPPRREGKRANKRRRVEQTFRPVDAVTGDGGQPQGAIDGPRGPADGGKMRGNRGPLTSASRVEQQPIDETFDV